ncbi:alpha/beta fold hydrolase [Notoacmeibacter sp. MSK16QG-6]|uniref:alpha/beta fold hydrolase n=1 Tax=Notoacmeibacter sp. MSK16QG-6 TaxID=2957982 RepID=UPI00209CABF2|nr:alpha/beta hydrolase [Notoacmeibacter sp. MSK16QG-6]MCP1199466.1 alpha/beta hydrolase [Notoacmeibacter sp. MSK16QG-6]
MTEVQSVEVNGLSIAYEIDGSENAPLLLCLHGFPEYRAGWSDVSALLKARFRIVRPDQRGYGESDKPKDVEAYRVHHLARDMFGLMDAIAPEQSFFLAGHDWGASVAYAMAFSEPEKIDRLVIVNGAHPATFQKALIDDPQQREASFYIPRLKAENAESRLAEDNYRRLLDMMERFSDCPFLDKEKRQAYRDAWSRPGALSAMLNWYRASPIVVPVENEAVEDVPVLAIDQERLRVRMPHLLIWGEDDAALRPSVIEGLDSYADDLRRVFIPGAGHWVLHEKAQKVAELIAAFLGEAE